MGIFKLYLFQKLQKLLFVNFSVNVKTGFINVNIYYSIYIDRNLIQFFIVVYCLKSDKDFIIISQDQLKIFKVIQT